MLQASTGATPAGGRDWSDRLITATVRVSQWLIVSYRAWRSRQELSRLQSFDDRMLKDIGVERSDLDWAKAQPWPVDATIALAGRVERRRARIRLLRRLRQQSAL